MTPVAGGVAHGEHHGAMKAPGCIECLVAPGVPVHRIVGVLAKVGARLKVEAVGVFGRAIRVQVSSARALAGGPGGPGALELTYERIVKWGRSGQRSAEAPAGFRSIGPRIARSRCRRAGSESRRSGLLTKVHSRGEQTPRRQEPDRATSSHRPKPSSRHSTGFFFHMPFSSNQV